MSRTRPEVHADGITHRYGCTTPEPIVLPSQMAGWRFHRCPECGAARLERTTAPKEANR